MEREGALVSPTSTDRGKSLWVWLAGVARLRDYSHVRCLQQSKRLSLTESHPTLGAG